MAVSTQADAASVGAPPARPPLSRPLAYSVCFTVTMIWLLLDQATKALAVMSLPAHGPSGLDYGVVTMRLVRNEDAAFGIPGFTGMFVLVTVVIVVLIALALRRTDRLLLVGAYGLVGGGALGNVGDRLFRAPGFPDGAVVDFIDLGWWPVFNLADVGIVVGALLVLVLLVVVEREERVGRTAPEGDGTGQAQTMPPGSGEQVDAATPSQ